MAKKRYDEKKEHILNLCRIRRKNNPEQMLLNLCKARAIKKNLPFNLELCDIVIPEFCPLLEIKLESSIGRVSPNSPSLDRIIPSLGYVKGNIWVISHRANAIKNSSSLEELQFITKKLEKKEI